MFQSSRHESNDSINFKLPWDNNTARGFAIAIAILILILLISPYLKIEQAPPIREIQTVPITLLNFGKGDGTGLRHGNLTEEGKKNSAQAPKTNLHDAQSTPKTVDTKITKFIDPSNASNFVPRDKTPVNNQNKTKNTGEDKDNVGDPRTKVADAGSGLGSSGIGKGAGDGFGLIDWGGGGNRTVQAKKLPDIPKGVRTSAQIKLRFRVLPDGTVSSVIPMQKADPQLEYAAIEALKKWRFNPIDPKKGDMVGTIPLTFILR